MIRGQYYEINRVKCQTLDYDDSITCRFTVFNDYEEARTVSMEGSGPGLAVGSISESSLMAGGSSVFTAVIGTPGPSKIGTATFSVTANGVLEDLFEMTYGTKENVSDIEEPTEVSSLPEFPPIFLVMALFTVFVALRKYLK